MRTTATNPLTTALFAALFMALAPAALVPAALAQDDYGVGETIIVPRVDPAMLTLDGEYEADVWDTGAEIDLLGATSWWAEGFPQDITDAWARVLFAEDTLYIYAFVDDNELYADDDAPWVSDGLAIGFDPVHEAGTTDMLVDQDDWAGWPDNAPDGGPHAYKIFLTEDGAGAVTLNFDAAAAAEYVRGGVFRDEDNQDWGIEAAFYLPAVEQGALVGFNIGGVQANAAACEADATEGECGYGYYSRWSTENPGGDVYSRTDSYGTLQMGAGGGEGYGSGLTLQVPQVDPGAITIDGEADEAAWTNAAAGINAVQYWNAYGPVGEATPVPDLVTETRLLWSEDTLYVHHLIQDIEIFWGGDTGSYWNSDMALVGLDGTAEGDSLFGPDFDGGVSNAPSGPQTYFVNGPAGFTFAWIEDVSPADSGWVNGVVFVDEDNLEWGFEAAFYLPQAEMGALIGFDIGGAQASAEQCEEGFCDYAYYAWQSGANGVDPGAINRDASQWAALQLVDMIDTGVEERADGKIPAGFALAQNYPNPFRDRTQIRYELPAPGHVRLAVYDLLGREVATLVDAPRTASTYDVTWSTDGLPGGVYFYRVELDGDVVAARTMTVVK